MQSKMASKMFLTKPHHLNRTTLLKHLKHISTFPFLTQEPLLAHDPPIPQPDPSPTHFPPSPSSGSPLYSQNWRSPTQAHSHSLIPHSLFSPHRPTTPHADAHHLLNLFGDWITSQRWPDVKTVFESWIKSLDHNGKPNKPNVELFNHYLRAHLMCRSSAVELLDVVGHMEEYGVEPNTASFNIVLKAMHQARETTAAEKLLQRMLQSGKESHPDDESYDLVISMLFLQNQVDAALKYVDLTLKSGNKLSMRAFVHCVQSCMYRNKLDNLVSIIEKCKAMDQNRALTPSWNLCNSLAEAAMQNDNSKLAFLALGFMARIIQQGDIGRPTINVQVNEGLVISALSTAARTQDSTLLEASWAILKRSLREKKVPNAETYLAKINALASLGNLPGAFNTLRELEKVHASSTVALDNLLSPFTSLRPLAVACSRKGFETLDLVYFQLENLSRADPPYKSVAALNCVILGCANIWDLDRAYQTFEAIGSTFGLTPSIHSYNALMHAFGKLGKTQEATRVFEHLSGLGVNPNAMSYSLLVDAHLVNRDPKGALAVLDAMVKAGFEPSRETLKKVRRRCNREIDYESRDHVESLAKEFKIPIGIDSRSNMLFNMEYSTEFAM